MYGDLSNLLDPSINEDGFGLPASCTTLRHELSVFPKLYDEEGRQYLPSKSKHNADDKRRTLTEMIGHSPNDADALVLAVHGMLHKPQRTKAGVS